MSTSQLLLYNDALLLCGETPLSSVSEAREARYLCDQAWDSGAVDYCLEQGQWTFATRAESLEYSPSVEPPFGLRRAFDKPDDYIRTTAVCQDEFFKVPLLDYADEANFWFANLDVIYIKYVSNDAQYGNNLGNWPGTFSELVSTFIASKIVHKLTQDKERILMVKKELDRTMKNANSKDAMNNPSKFPPMGSWGRARTRGGRGWGDGGNQNNLIG